MGELRVALQPIVQTDPAFISSDPEIIIASSVYDYLVDVTETGESFYHKAKPIDRINLGMVAQHQAIAFNVVKMDGLRYDLTYSLASDYALICKIYKGFGSEDISYVDFPVCKYLLGGVIENHDLMFAVNTYDRVGGPIKYGPKILFRRLQLHQ